MVDLIETLIFNEEGQSNECLEKPIENAIYIVLILVDNEWENYCDSFVLESKTV